MSDQSIAVDAGRMYGSTSACLHAEFGQTYRYCFRYSPIDLPGFHDCRARTSSPHGSHQARGRGVRSGTGTPSRVNTM